MSKSFTKVLTPKEIATELKVKEQTVMKWLREGTLRGLKFGRLWRVKEEDFQKFIEERSQESRRSRRSGKNSVIASIEEVKHEYEEKPVENRTWEEEKKIIAERTAIALNHKKRNLKAYSPTPFGFIRINDSLVKDEDEWKIVTLIFRLYDEGFTYEQIANELNRRGVPGKRGGKWYASTVRYIYLNDLYRQNESEGGERTMRRVVKGRVIDTERMTKLAEVKFGNLTDYNYVRESLFYDPDSKSFYLYGRGGAASRYAEPVGINQWSEGEKLLRLTKGLALLWLEENQISIDEELEKILEEVE